MSETSPEAGTTTKPTTSDQINAFQATIFDA